MTTVSDLSAFGGGIDRGPHVSLMDVSRAVLAAGIRHPGNTEPLRAWREPQAEIQHRVFVTTMLAVQHACPDAPPTPEPYPEDTDYAFERKQELQQRPEQTTLTEMGVDG